VQRLEFNLQDAMRERGEPNCPRCAQQMSNCKKTGCWTEAPKQGGKKHCNLTKS
jgi:hypothetical protein